jgi:hypothetical protein
MDNLFRKLKTAVSRDKRRYIFGQYDLDLTYITERIIGSFCLYFFFVFEIRTEIFNTHTPLTMINTC